MLPKRFFVSCYAPSPNNIYISFLLLSENVSILRRMHMLPLERKILLEYNSFLKEVDLTFCWAHVFEGTFSDVTAQPTCLAE